MTRHHLPPLKDRILKTLHAGEMDAAMLSRRLGTAHLHDTLHRLEAEGRVRCVESQHGSEAAVWALPGRHD